MLHFRKHLNKMRNTCEQRYKLTKHKLPRANRASLHTMSWVVRYARTLNNSFLASAPLICSKFHWIEPPCTLTPFQTPFFRMSTGVDMSAV